MGSIRNFKKKKIFHFVFFIAIVLIIVAYLASAYQNSFDETIFSVDNVYEHIRELTSQKYNGRLAGTEGNELALKYIEDQFIKLGIDPGGENNTYSQEFEALIPDIDTQPVFRIEAEDGTVLEELKMYEDYRAFTYGVGTGINFEGEILLVDTYLYKIKPELIKDRLVVMSGHQIVDSDIEYVLKNGGKGILYSQMSTYKSDFGKKEWEKSIVSGWKHGGSMFFGPLGRKVYVDLIRHSSHELLEKEYQDFGEAIPNSVSKKTGIIKGVELKCDLNFPIVKSGNILGKIEGKKNGSGYLIIGAAIDHVGSGIDGKYFPGALDNASGVGMMLELARVIKVQKNLPYKSIIFAGWNAEESGSYGSKYYVKNPIYPLEKSQVISLYRIGDRSVEKIIASGGKNNKNIIRSKLYQYAKDFDIDIKEIDEGSDNDYYWFLKENVPSVQLTDGNSYVHTYEDTIDKISKENLEKVGIITTNYIKRDIFRDTIPDYLNKVELTLLILFILGAVFIYILFHMKKANSSVKIFSITIEDIYYSSIFKILSKGYYFITPVFIILFSLIFIANLPPDFNIVFNNGEVHTNLSMYLALKKSVLYIRNFILHGFGTTGNHAEILDVVIDSMGRSFKLIFATIIISFIFGISKGIFDSYKDSGKGNLRTVGTLVALSLPDVLIVLLGMTLIVHVSSNDVLNQYIDPKILRRFIMPLLTLSIIPTVYISRITFIAVQEELKKEYISAAKAKGLSKPAIYMKHILSIIVFKIIDAIPALMTIIISNLIVVEYLFYYRGVVFNLYMFYKKHDVNSFIGLSLALGFIYVLFIIMSKVISKLINPMKREGSH